MKIMHVITRFIRGGADENTLLTCNGQLARGHTVHLVVGQEHHPDMLAKLDKRVHLHILETLVRPVAPAQDVSCFWQLRGLMREITPDIVHTHESKAGILGRLAAAAAGVPTIIHGVHILPFVGVGRAKAALFLGLEKLASRWTHAYVDVSAGMRDICLHHGLGSTGNHVIAPSGMDTARFLQASVTDVSDVISDPRLLPEHGQRPVLMLIAGALEPRKQVAELITALASLRDAGDWRLMIVGDGIQRAELEALVDRLGMADRIVFLGHRGDLENIIAVADLCVHAATNEGLPRVVVQYVLGGRPVIASQLAGMERLVVEGVNGHLVTAGDVGALAEAAVALGNDPARRDRYATASRRLDLSAWDVESMLDRIEEAYGLAREDIAGKLTTAVP